MVGPKKARKVLNCSQDTQMCDQGAQLPISLLYCLKYGFKVRSSIFTAFKSKPFLAKEAEADETALCNQRIAT